MSLPGRSLPDTADYKIQQSGVSEAVSMRIVAPHGSLRWATEMNTFGRSSFPVLNRQGARFSLHFARLVMTPVFTKPKTPPASYLFTASLNALPAVNLMVFDAAI